MPPSKKPEPGKKPGKGKPGRKPQQDRVAREIERQAAIARVKPVVDGLRRMDGRRKALAGGCLCRQAQGSRERPSPLSAIGGKANRARLNCFIPKTLRLPVLLLTDRKSFRQSPQ